MARAMSHRTRVDSVVDVILMLSDEEIWDFVCRMHPEGSQELREDVCDVLLALKRQNQPHHSFEQVFGRKATAARVK